MSDKEESWPACRPRARIVQQCPTPADWADAVERLCRCERHVGSMAADETPVDGEVNLVLLHGQRAWVEGWIRAAAGESSRSGLLVVLTPWSSGAAAAILRQAADDVVGSSIEGQELCARIHAILRRVRAASGGNARVPLPMRPAERRLLEYLRASPGRVVTQNELLHNVFGGPRASGTSLVRVHISRLRRRLGGAAALRTVRGEGYLLEVEELRGE